MTAGTPLLRGNRRKWNTNEGVGSDDLNNMGLGAMGLVCDLLLHRIYASGDGLTVQTGWMGRADAIPTISTLTVTVGAGIGAIPSTTVDPETSEWDVSYLPIVIPEPDTVTLAARPASVARYDLVQARPVWDSADQTTRRVRPAGPGSQATQSLYTRHALGYELAVKTGASAPTADAGYLPVALVYVPPTGADIIMRDVRPMLEKGSGWEAIPPGDLIQAHIQSGLAASAGSGLTVNVSDGEAVHAGKRVRVLATNSACTDNGITLGTAHATLDRIDGVYLAWDGSSKYYLAVKAGTAAASPERPNWVGASEFLAPIAFVLVEAASTTVGTITDARRTKPYNFTSHIEAKPVVAAQVTIAAQGGGDLYRRASIQAVAQGGDYAGEVYFRITTWYAASPDLLDAVETSRGTVVRLDNDITPVGQRVVIGGTVNTFAIVKTDENGYVEIDITKTGAATGYVKVEPILWHDATTAGAESTTGEPDYIPGGATEQRVTFT